MGNICSTAPKNGTAKRKIPLGVDEAVGEELPRVSRSQCGNIFVPIDSETKNVLPVIPERLPPDQQPALTRQLVRKMSESLTHFFDKKPENFSESRQQVDMALKVMKFFMSKGPPQEISRDFEAEMSGGHAKTIAGSVSGFRENWAQFQEIEKAQGESSEQEMEELFHGND